MIFKHLGKLDVKLHINKKYTTGTVPITDPINITGKFFDGKLF